MSRIVFCAATGGVLGGAAALLLLCGCVPSEAPLESGAPSKEAALDLSNAVVVDLTYAYDENTLYWPTSPSRFELEVLAHGETEAGFFYSANSFCTPEHGGTHLDAPIHFADERWTTDEIPVERLSAPVVVIDVSESAAVDRDYRLTVDDVRAWEERNGEIPAGAIVALRTGWGEYWPNALDYLGDDTPGDASKLSFPSFGEQAARLLVEERGVVGLGVDTASIDYGASTDFLVHRVASEANVYGLENLAHLDELPETGAWMIALPTKVGGGSGAPVRVVVLLPSSAT